MGLPGENKYGAVRFYRRVGSNLVEIPELHLDARNAFWQKLGRESGLSSSFGFSLAVLDVNNDGFDDIIVGAPQYFHSENGYEVGGAVFVFTSGAIAPFTEPQMMTGPEGSNFGHSLTSLGDVDRDGFEDFAVGAPYQKNSKNPESSGAVYIYNGNRDGMMKHSQVIAELKDENLKNLGLSLKGDVDVDGNEHPDLVIGAKDRVVILRTKPVISIQSTIELKDKEGNIVTEIDPAPLAPNICKEDGVEFSCVDVQVCFA